MSPEAEEIIRKGIERACSQGIHQFEPKEIPFTAGFHKCMYCPAVTNAYFRPLFDKARC